mmetsp:Transcript_28578/g.43735  ORF Transcript_28578/g.43735 Transcript_28578/m.43735 type:complete len:327 (+) Transcript_28578:293-1273(+)
MKVLNKSLLLLLAVISSSSTASSFGTYSPKPTIHAHQSKIFNRSYFSIRGGSDESLPDPSRLQSTELGATSDLSSDEEDPAEEVSANIEVSSVQDQPPVSSETSLINVMGPNSTSPGFLRKLFPSFPWQRLPNLLTYVRCLAIPGLVIQFYLSNAANKNMVSSIVFAIASLTDYLDGYLARRWDICSPFGAFLDPVADKLMVSTALIILSGKYGAAVAVPSAIILAREISVSALREWMASKGKRDSVKVGFQGKCKTALTMLSLTVILAVPDGWSAVDFGINGLIALDWDFVMNIGMVMLYLSALVTVTSGSVYFKAAAPVLMGKE